MSSTGSYNPFNVSFNPHRCVHHFIHYSTSFLRFSTLQKAGGQLPIHRSHSVPVLNKDGSLCLGGAFRVIPTTPRAIERTVSKTSCTSPKDDDGNYAFQLSFTLCSHHFPCRNLPKCRDIPIACIILATFNPSFATSDNQPMPYLSFVVQMEVMMMAKILLKKKLFVEFA